MVDDRGTLLHTLAAATQDEQIIRKSRFLTHAAPVDSPAAALQFIERISAADATHNCWAYRIGQEYRFNDDGEPSGTAGRPILAAIDGQQMDGVVVVVIRWFGGVKLGAGGLIRAYGGCAAECLRKARRVPLVDLATVSLHCDFAAIGMLEARLDDFSATLREQVFGSEGAQMELAVPRDNVEALGDFVRDLTRGRDGFTVID